MFLPGIHVITVVLFLSITAALIDNAVADPDLLKVTMNKILKLGSVHIFGWILKS